MASKKGSDEITENLIQDLFLSAGVLKSAFGHIHEKIKNELLHRSDYIILAILRKRKSATMSEIGNMLYISKPNLTAMVDGLIEKKLVRREYDKEDRRIIRIHITEKGEETLKNAKSFMKKEMKKKLGELNEKDVNELHRAFKSIRDIFSKIK